MIAPLVIGFFFGFMLQRGRMGRYEVIVGVFRFTDLTVLKFLMTALVVAMVTTQALSSLGLAAATPMPETYWAGNFFGGLLFGVGMAVAGFCPGTVAAGAGEGRLDYLIPGALGLFCGALAYGQAWPKVMPALTAIGRLGPVGAARALGVEPWLLILVFAEIAALLLYAVERGPLRKRTT